MNESSFRLLLLRFALLPVVAVCALMGVISFELHQINEQRAQGSRATSMILQCDRLLNNLVDTETGVRGYLITRDASFLEPYHTALAGLKPQLDQLSALASSNAAEGSDVAEIQADFERFNAVNRQLVEGASSQVDERQTLMLQKQAMDSLRGSLQKLTNEENTVRNEKRKELSQMFATLPLEMIVCGAIVALLLVWDGLAQFRRISRAFGSQIREIEVQRNSLHTTLQSIGDAVVVCDARGAITLFNPAAVAVTGWTAAQAIGEKLDVVFAIFNEDTREVVESPVEKVLRTGQVVGLANHTALRRRDGSEVAIDDSGAPVRDDKNAIVGVVLVFRDVQERRQAEETLLRTEKLVAVGRLAASIAHEMNNPLTSVTNLLYLIGCDETLNENTRGFVDRASIELDRVSKIATQTLRFARRTVSPGRVKLEEIVEGVLLLFSGRISKNQISIVVRNRNVSSFHGYASEIMQLLTNLIGNAIDAIGESGKIVVAMQDSYDWRTLRSCVAVSVADSGAGIPIELRRKIWEPFFTTKADIGTGLGLWLVEETAEKNGGTVRMRSACSAERHGTVFRLLLPIKMPAVVKSDSETD